LMAETAKNGWKKFCLQRNQPKGHWNGFMNLTVQFNKYYLICFLNKTIKTLC
jgi:hypothetical protein